MFAGTPKEAWFAKASAKRGPMPLELLDRLTVLAAGTPPIRDLPEPEAPEEEEEEAEAT